MILFLYGDDTYRSREKMHDIVQEHRAHHESGLNLVRVDMEERTEEASSLDAITVGLRTQSMFEEKKLVIIERPFSVSSEERTALKTLLDEEDAADQEDCIIVVWDASVSAAEQKRDDLFAFLDDTATTQEFAALTGQRLEGWLREEVANLDVPMTDDGRTALIQSVGEDLWRLRMELQKLRDYAAQRVPKEDERVVDADVVRSLVTPTIETDIFQTIDALGQRNKVAALTLLRDHLQRGEHELQLLGMMAYQIRTLLQIKDLTERGVPFRDLSREANLKPFVVKKTYRQAKLFSLEELHAAHRLLFDLDYAIKTGALDARAALEQFVLAV